ncbi:hypothetical protein [Virgibacillus sp. SK37]|uniref:hypothetical protein n=1 Tax=Virgibacillus sp. SK37 TaxID=403957 RepID=UPI0004D1BF37|nr:hypothetical protein [Virgibacillus sp. SK37]AIF42850.1 hypothetical protein X953_06130 [Virgibacillus sp. SK37]
MRYITFLFFEAVIFSGIILVQFFLGAYIGAPFSVIDIIAGIMTFFLLGVLFYLLILLFQKMQSLSTKVKIILSIPCFLLTALGLGIGLSFLGIG